MVYLREIRIGNKKIFVSDERKVRQSALKLPLFPAKLYCLKQNGYLPVWNNALETAPLIYGLLIFPIIRGESETRNKKNKGQPRTGVWEITFYMRELILKWISSRGIDSFCIYKYTARLFLLPPRTCLPSDRWTINVKAAGEVGAKGWSGWSERGAEGGAHFCERVYSASGGEKERERDASPSAWSY